MRLVVHAGAEPFLAHAESFFVLDPFSTSVISTLAMRVAAGAIPSSEDYLWVAIEQDGRVVGAAMHTPPYNLFLSRMPGEAAVALAKELVHVRRDLPGVNGAVESTTAFSAVWEDLTGRPSMVERETRMYRLGDLIRPHGVSGGALLAEAPRDLKLVADWLGAFHEDAQPDGPVDDWAAVGRRRIEAGEVHLWSVEGEPVALAAVSQTVAGVARLGPVYTPPRRRHHGYASAVTAEATHAALSSGADHVVLYTDLANPISNSIYQAIGYRPDHDAEERTFR